MANHVAIPVESCYDRNHKSLQGFSPDRVDPAKRVHSIVGASVDGSEPDREKQQADARRWNICNFEIGSLKNGDCQTAGPT